MRDRLKKNILTAFVLGQLLLLTDAGAACDFDSGQQFFLQGDPAAANTALAQCVADGEREAESSFYLGIIARDADRLSDAASLLGRAVQLAPDDVTYKLELAVTHEWLGHLDDASDVYESILSVQPANLPARLGLARMLHWQGHLRNSIKTYRALLEAHPDSAAVKTGLAFALLADHKLDAARTLFADSLRSNPQDASARNGLNMLKKLRKHRVSIDQGAFEGGNGKVTRHFRAAVVSTPNYALRWGAEYFRSNEITRPLDVHGVPVYRSVKAARSLFADYRLNADNAVTLSWTGEKLGANATQNRLMIEARRQFSQKHRFFAGARTTRAGSKNINLVAHAGYTFTSGARWSLTGRFSHSSDREFADARAVSVFLDSAYRTRDQLRLGASVNASGGRSSVSLSFSSVNYLTRNLSFSSNLVSDLADRKGQLTFGVNYEF